MMCALNPQLLFTLLMFLSHESIQPREDHPSLACMSPLVFTDDIMGLGRGLSPMNSVLARSRKQEEGDTFNRVDWMKGLSMIT